MKEDHGFTLIELLMVIVILGVLSAVVVFSVAGINDKGEAAACHRSTAPACIPYSPTASSIALTAVDLPFAPTP